MASYKSGYIVLGVAALAAMAHAIDVTGTAPRITITANVNPAIRSAIETEMNKSLQAAFDKTRADADASLSGFDDPKDLAKGFANANAYSMNSATLQGYQNYDLFAVSAGFMVGFQAPSSDVSYYGKILDDITEKGDIYAGLGLGVTFLNVGLNAGFLVPGLYLNAKWGAMERDFGDEFSFKFNVMGVGANYRLFDPKSLAGIVKWRGLSVGSGVYHQGSEINSTLTFDPISNDVNFRENVLASVSPAERPLYEAALDEMGFTAANPSATMSLIPSFTMGLDVSTITVPVDVTTAVSILWGLFNVNAGFGFDLNFGSSEITLAGNADAPTETPDPTRATVGTATVTISGGSDDGPSFARTRFMTGFGFGLGPVKLDVPLYYYPASGMAFGVSLAVVW